jgi:autotransporter-associated beta strand protein
VILPEPPEQESGSVTGLLASPPERGSRSECDAKERTPMTNATWKKHPGTNNYDTGSNWSGDAVPDGTAFFGNSLIHSLSFSADTSVGGWTFKVDAPRYTFIVPTGHFLEFLGAGIVVKGGSVGITNDQDLHFENQSTDGLAHITNNNVTEFNGGSMTSRGSTAGRAHITNNAMTLFDGWSTAGAATIDNNSGTLTFHDSSTAGKANITNGDLLEFRETSTAGSAIIANTNALRFLDTSSAGKAHIIADVNGVNFFDSSTAGSAVIVTTNGDSDFFENSTGGNARFITKAGATVDFSGSSGLAADGLLTAGSIEGAGDYFLGDNILVVGGNNRSTRVSGLIADGGGALGHGAVLDKVGTGTLKLSHEFNTYSGGTVIFAGTLDIAAKGAAGTGITSDISFFAVPDAFPHQTLKIENKALSVVPSAKAPTSQHFFFANNIDSFHKGDAIDLAGLQFVAGAKATFNAFNGELLVKSGHVTVLLSLKATTFVAFKVRDDGHGGTKIVPNTVDAKPLAQAPTESQISDHRTHADDASVSADNFQFRHQAELSRHGATSFDPHLGLGAETLAFNEHVANMQGTDHEAYLANFHIDMHDDHIFMV